MYSCAYRLLVVGSSVNYTIKWPVVWFGHQTGRKNVISSTESTLPIKQMVGMARIITVTTPGLVSGGTNQVAPAQPSSPGVHKFHIQLRRNQKLVK